MKNFRVSFILVIVVGSFGYAGGEFSEVTAYEIEDVIVAEEAYMEPLMEEPVYIEPVYIKPEPVVVKPALIAPVPIAIAPKNIVTNGFYAGLGITGVRYDNDCSCKTSTTNKTIKKNNKDTTYGLMARVGYDFNQYIGIEARGARTNWDSDGSKVKHAGIYVKPMLPVGGSSNIYGLVGIAKTKVTGNMPTVDAEGLALGAGIEVDLSRDTPKDGKYSRKFDGHGDQEKGVGVFIDYERMHVKSSSPDIDAISAGITYDF